MRLEKIDILRGIAIILMVIFHIHYSLVYIFGMNVLFFSEIFWFIMGKVAAILFIGIAGISFYLAERKYETTIVLKYLKVSVVLGLIAGGISTATYVFLPEHYIRFGIIHFFSLSFLLLLLFRKLQYYNFLAGIIIITIGVYFVGEVTNKYMYALGFTYPGFSSGDFYPIFPYFGIMLLGYSLGLFLGEHEKLHILAIQNKTNIFFETLGKIGKYSLIIYIIHQPIIIGIIWIYEYSKNNL